MALCAWKVQNVAQRTPRPEKHPDWICWPPLGWQQTSNGVQSLTVLWRNSNEQRAQGRDSYLELKVFVENQWRALSPLIEERFMSLFISHLFHISEIVEFLETKFLLSFGFQPTFHCFERLMNPDETLFFALVKRHMKILTFVYLNHRRSLNPFLFRNYWTITVWSLAQLYISTSSGYGNSSCS